MTGCARVTASHEVPNAALDLEDFNVTLPADFFSARALREAIDDLSSEAAEAFLDDLNNVSPARAADLIEEYACTVIGIATQAGRERGCGTLLAERLLAANPSEEFFEDVTNAAGEIESVRAFQAHHLIPSQLGAQGGRRNRPHPLAVRGQRDTNWDINGASNGLRLPNTDERSIREGLPKHRGPHGTYTNQVEAALDEAREDVVNRYRDYYSDLENLLDDAGLGQPLPTTPDTPLPDDLLPLDKAIENALNDVAGQFKKRLTGMGGGTTVNHLGQ